MKISTNIRRGSLVAVFLTSICAAIVAGLCFGADPLSLKQIWFALTHIHSNSPDAVVIWQLRLPRVILAGLVGALLGMAGAALQGLLRNDLADPYTIGVSSGAAVGAAGVVLLGLESALFGYSVPLAAFVTGLLAAVIVFASARRQGLLDVNNFLLAGIVVGSFLWAMVTLFMSLAQADTARILFWLMGSFADADWSRVRLLLPFVLLGLVGLRAIAFALNGFALGEESAWHLGFDVEKTKKAASLLATLCTAAAVSVSGIIGFVGLMAPHIARRLFGADHRILVFTASGVGAVLLMCADTLARTLARPAEVPVGVITALIGSPMFIFLLRRRSE